MRTSHPTNARDLRSGFSLLEILVVLAIFGLSAALIMPSTSRMLDQATSHAVFFEFQQQVSDLRREANRTGLPLHVVEASSARPSYGPTGEVRTLLLRSPWSYTLAPDLDIAAGGTCSASSANLINGDRVVMTLRTIGSDCQFIRLQTTAAPPLASSSR